ncbi:MAG: regulatory protein [Clostridia bacterium]|nr:regulatory protein [Clostridia bacterium]
MQPKTKKPNNQSKTAAWNYALRLLTFRQRSCQEMRLRLKQKGFIDEIINQTLEKLKDLNLLDDVRFAEDWASYRVNNHPMGGLRLKQELQQRGIEPSLAEEVVAKVLTPGLELVLAEKLAQRYCLKNYNKNTNSKRLAQYLWQRGFNIDIIYQVITKIDMYKDVDS